MPTSDSQLLEGSKVRIGKQIVLPFSKAIEISLRGVKVRFWRSMITMSGIILAIAFMVSVWVGGAVLEGLRSPGVRDRQVISQVAQETDKLVFRVLDGSGQLVEEPRTVELKRARAIRNSVSYIIRSSEPGSTAQAEAEPPKPARPGPGHEAAAAGAEKTQGGKDYWLVVLSLCVAVVGIVNAMLMSVTERFREIGTMKCLGALDSFIIKLFLLESTFQGLAGTCVGILIGLAMTLALGMWDYGGYVFGYFPVFGILRSALAALVAGTVLSLVGAMLPAYKAAKMEPVEAMRSDT